MKSLKVTETNGVNECSPGRRPARVTRHGDPEARGQRGEHLLPIHGGFDEGEPPQGVSGCRQCSRHDDRLPEPLRSADDRPPPSRFDRLDESSDRLVVPHRGDVRRTRREERIHRESPVSGPHRAFSTRLTGSSEHESSGIPRFPSHPVIGYDRAAPLGFAGGRDAANGRAFLPR